MSPSATDWPDGHFHLPDAAGDFRIGLAWRLLFVDFAIVNFGAANHGENPCLSPMHPERVSAERVGERYVSVVAGGGSADAGNRPFSFKKRALGGPVRGAWRTFRALAGSGGHLVRPRTSPLVLGARRRQAAGEQERALARFEALARQARQTGHDRLPGQNRVRGIASVRASICRFELHPGVGHRYFGCRYPPTQVTSRVSRRSSQGRAGQPRPVPSSEHQRLLVGGIG